MKCASLQTLQTLCMFEMYLQVPAMCRCARHKRRSMRRTNLRAFQGYPAVATLSTTEAPAHLMTRMIPEGSKDIGGKGVGRGEGGIPGPGRA